MLNHIGLSKSKYCNGVICPKILWLDKNKPDEAISKASSLVLENGNRVGQVAREYFGEYSLVEYDEDKTKMCAQTVELMKSGAVNIAEASFSYEGLYSAVDILKKNDDGWDIVEVKSSTKVKPTHEDDVAFQYYVLTKSGINVKRVYILHVNNQYVFHEKLDIKGLLTLEDYTEQCIEKCSEVAEKIVQIRNIVSMDSEPDIDLSISCYEPYNCAYQEYCKRNLPEHSVFDIRGLAKKTMLKNYKAGIVSFEDIVENNVKISDKQMQQVLSVINNEDMIDREATKAFLDSLSYPIYHLDFETFQLAIPEYEGCKPYEQLPFQYSLHIEYEDGTYKHEEFLADAGADPRRALAEKLVKDIPMGSFSMAFNMSFEKRVIKALAEIYPDLAEQLMDIYNNMHDLMIPFQKHDYYVQDLNGSYSIKYVLPALCPGDPELDYHSLDQVHNGLEASKAFITLSSLESQEEIKKLRNNLLKYCGLDTLAMVKVLGKLREECDQQ